MREGGRRGIARNQSRETGMKMERWTIDRESECEREKEREREERMDHWGGVEEGEGGLQTEGRWATYLRIRGMAWDRSPPAVA